MIIASAAEKKKNTTFRGDVIRLLSGNGLAQIITIAATPILTRLFEPEVFGQAALFATITSVLAVVACMSYEYAIVSPKSDKQAANLLVASIIICTLYVFGIVAPFIFFFGVNLLTWVRMEELRPVLWLIPLMVWVSGMFMALNYWNTRSKHFTRLSIAKVVGTGIGNGGSLSFGFAGYLTGIYMIIGQFAGQAVSAAVLGGQIFRGDGRFIRTSLSCCSSKRLLGRYRNFPLYYTGSNLVNSLSAHLPIFLFAAFFSPAVLGFYALALRLLQAPMGLVGGAISQVFHEKATKAHLDGTLSELVTSTFKKLVYIGVFPILVTGIFAVELFGFVFGKNWAEAGLYVAILSPWIAFYFVSSPLSILTAVLELQKISLLFGISSIVFGLFSILVGWYYFDSAVLALVLFSLSGVIIALFKCFIYNWYAKVLPSETFSIIFIKLWWVVFPIIYIIGVNFWFSNLKILIVIGYGFFILIWFYLFFSRWDYNPP